MTISYDIGNSVSQDLKTTATNKQTKLGVHVRRKEKINLIESLEMGNMGAELHRGDENIYL